MSRITPWLTVGMFVLSSAGGKIFAQDIQDKPEEQWITVTEQATGMDQKAKDEALAKALRRAVEQACGVFLTSESKTQNYQGVYDRIFADAVGYVKEYNVVKTWIQDGCYFVKIDALVSTQKFEKDWAVIAHTYAQEANPRVIVVIGQTTYEMVNDLEKEEQHAAAEAMDVQAEARSRGEVSVGGAAVQEADAAAVAGTVSRRGRLRPRNWATMSAEQREAWLARMEAEERSSATVSGTVTRQETDNYKTWRRVADTLAEGGSVQTKIEDFFLEKGIKLVDRETARKVNKRDLALANAQGDLDRLAALGAQFDADVVILGTAAAKTGGETQMTVAGQTVRQHEYRAKLVVRAVRTDSAQLLVSKVYQVSARSMRKGGEEAALDRLAEEAAPQLLSAVVDAWRKQVHVTRDIQLQIDGMTYNDFKTFQTAVQTLRGVQSVHLREITDNVANISIGYEFPTRNLADRLTELKEIRLEVTEFNPHRLKMRVVRKK